MEELTTSKPLPRRAPLHRSRSAFSVALKPTATTPSPAIELPIELLRRLPASQINPLPLIHARRDEARKTEEQFERMMDRFQLRRVAHPSSHSQAISIPAKGDAVAPPPGPSDAPEPTARRQWKKRIGPWAATGTISLVRTVVISLVAIVHLVIFPLQLAYEGIDSSMETHDLMFNVAADFVFLSSLVILCNTATYTTRGQLVTTRRAIFRHYRRDRLFLDVLACLPLEVLPHRITRWFGLLLFGRLVVRLVVAYRQRRQFILLWTHTTTDSDLKWLDWLLYSRFAHLIRVGRLILRVDLLTHYMACAWTVLNLHEDHALEVALMNRSAMGLHLHSIYDVLQLLQGQDLDTKTVAQDLFGSIAVLLGSISLAVIFGHVAILIGNFSANQTAYQRKIESVFAIMEKLQLPQAIRDRVHQYYGYLHTEYESLDGEVVKFAKDLSHTLELEVVLYKYMDVVMNVPHWIDCSPDFQKQLVLNMTIRVYLPDDFVIRRGEVGTSCFIVNRGICKQYQFADEDDDIPTVPLHNDHAAFIDATRAKRASELKFLVRDDLPSIESPRPAEFRPVFLTRGHAVGERALIDNYVRTTDVRAFTYVEMCVLEREPFQRMLTRYPEDRDMVLTSIVHQWMRQQGSEGPVMEMVREVAPDATLDEAVGLVVDTMSPALPDPTILFGGTDHSKERLRRRVNAEKRTVEDRFEQLQAQLDRIERALETRTSGGLQQAHAPAETSAPLPLVNNEPTPSASTSANSPPQDRRAVATASTAAAIASWERLGARSARRSDAHAVRRSALSDAHESRGGGTTEQSVIPRTTVRLVLFVATRDR